MTATNAALVAEGDLDELTRHLERLCSARDWLGVLDLRQRCRQAFERGHQLWPVSAHAEYRLALEAPGPQAAQVLEPGAGRFALGPLTEVAASTHTWAELADHLPAGPARAFVAHERVVRGEDLSGDGRVNRGVLELPLALQPWEPDYPVATYRPDKADFPGPELPPLLPTTGPAQGLPEERWDDAEVSTAVRQLVEHWVTESEGAVTVVGVCGEPADAVREIGGGGARMVEIGPATSLALMAWAGASGGSHGRRRGAASGRFGAWWVLAALGGMLDQWPPPPDELGEVASGFRWLAWDTGRPDPGWSLRLALAEHGTDEVLVVAATDPARPAQEAGPSTRSR